MKAKRFIYYMLVIALFITFFSKLMDTIINNWYDEDTIADELARGEYYLNIKVI